MQPMLLHFAGSSCFRHRLKGRLQRCTDGAALGEILDDDGPGSGLNADLLDGQDSTAFMSATADNWVNTTGDTMTGHWMPLMGIIPITRVSSSQ